MAQEMETSKLKVESQVRQISPQALKAPQSLKAPQALSAPVELAPKPTKTVSNAKLVQNVSAASYAHDGMDFPRVAQTKSTGGFGICDIGEQDSFTQNFDHTSKKRAKKSWSETKDTVYSPTGYVVLQGNVAVSSKKDPASFTTQLVPKNFSFNSSGEYSQVQTEMFDFVFGLDIPDTIKADVNTQLETYVSNYQSYTTTIGSSHGAFKVETVVHGTGRLARKKNAYSWVRGSLNVDGICAPPEISDPSILQNLLEQWVNEVTADYVGTGGSTGTGTGGVIVVGTIADADIAEAADASK
ncbi:MAG: hypothetical protein P8H62_07630 [Henriciella sp.]|nr:hypothetical protein [Henriciella sp.]